MSARRLYNLLALLAALASIGCGGCATAIGHDANWSVGARAGMGIGLGPTWGGTVEGRATGPLWIGVWRESTKTAGVSLRVEL